MRANCAWSDAYVLNVSSHGLMITAQNRGALEGATVELWHGERMIVAKIVWRKGVQAGLRSEVHIPVNEIMELDRGSLVRLTGPGWPQVERRRGPRSHDESRLRGRIMEFAGVAAILVSLTVVVLTFVQEAFARPLSYVEAALIN